MAYNEQIIPILDLRKSTALGVAIPFSAPTVFTSVYSTKEQTKYNLINFLLTDTRERPMNPNFGAGLRSYIFESIQTQTLEQLELSIQSKIENNFNNIEITSLDVIGDPDTNTIDIKFSYRLLNTNEIDTAVIKLQNT